MSQMTKKKEDSLETRRKLIDSAFENFFKNGFENTSLDKISKDVDVSRGAAYWHFKNKDELFRATVLKVLENIADQKEPIYSDKKISFREKVMKIIAIPYNYNDNYEFLQRASKTIESNEEFQDLFLAIENKKRRLYQFFLDGLNGEIRQSSKPIVVNPEALASLLFTYFEGRYVSIIPEEVMGHYIESTIAANIDFIFRALHA